MGWGGGVEMLIMFPNKICNMLAGCQPCFLCFSPLMDNDNRHDSTATRCRIHRRWTGDRKLNISAKSYLAWSFFSSFSLTAEGGSSRRPSRRFGSDIFSLLGLQWNYSSNASRLQNASRISLAVLNIPQTYRSIVYCQIYSFRQHVDKNRYKIHANHDFRWT